MIIRHRMAFVIRSFADVRRSEENAAQPSPVPLPLHFA